jgi:CBS-domain-containing membrane protein
MSLYLSNICYNYFMFKEILKVTKIEAVMSKKVVFVRDNDEFALVQEKLAANDIRHLPVVNDAGNVVGLISQRHLYKIHSPRRLENGDWYYDKDQLNEFILKNVMVPDPFTLRADQSLYEALTVIVTTKLGCIPIVDQYRRPVGMLTRSDFLKFFLNQ